MKKKRQNIANRIGEAKTRRHRHCWSGIDHKASKTKRYDWDRIDQAAKVGFEGLQGLTRGSEGDRVKAMLCIFEKEREGLRSRR